MPEEDREDSGDLDGRALLEVPAWLIMEEFGLPVNMVNQSASTDC